MFLTHHSVLSYCSPKRTEPMAAIFPLSDTRQPTTGNSSMLTSAAALCPWAALEIAGRYLGSAWHIACSFASTSSSLAAIRSVSNAAAIVG